MKFASLLTPEGRRAYAFAGVMGGCVVMTLFAAVGVWLVSGNVEYSFYLALSAHAQILVGLTALGAQFVKRTLKVGKDGVEISDNAEPIVSGDTVKIEKEPGA